MKSIGCYFLIIYMVFISVSIDAQKFNYGAFAATNINFLKYRSNYTIQDGAKAKPVLSYNLGGYLETNLEMINFQVSIEYFRIDNSMDPEFAMIDINQTDLGSTQSKIINHCIEINTIGTIRIIKGLYVGTGLSASYLVKSTFKTKEDFIIPGTNNLGNKSTINFYKKFVISVPVTIGYNFNRIKVFTQFNKGFMNRISGESYIKEIDNTLTLGIGYNINKVK